jgi:hypothetical protein
VIDEDGIVVVEVLLSVSAANYDRSWVGLVPDQVEVDEQIDARVPNARPD